MRLLGLYGRNLLVDYQLANSVGIWNRQIFYIFKSIGAGVDVKGGLNHFMVFGAMGIWSLHELIGGLISLRDVSLKRKVTKGPLFPPWGPLWLRFSS